MAISLNKLNVCIHQSTDTYMPVFLHAHAVMAVVGISCNGLFKQFYTISRGNRFFYIYKTVIARIGHNPGALNTWIMFIVLRICGEQLKYE